MASSIDHRTKQVHYISIPVIECNYFRLPDDIWLVDLDSNKITPPTGTNEDIPALPEPEGTILKNHLRQVRIMMLYNKLIRSLNRITCTACDCLSHAFARCLNAHFFLDMLKLFY